LDDTSGIGIDCYDGPAQSNTGIFNYTGPAAPSQSLSVYDDMDKFGEWTLTVSDHLLYNTGTLLYWSLTIRNAAQGDCNANGIPDECDISGGTSTDANGNGIPDECELVRPATVVSAVSRKACEVNILPRASEPRLGGADFVDVTFDDVVPACDATLEWAPCSGGSYAAYTGTAGTTCFTVGDHLYVNFSPSLETGYKYRISFGEGTTSLAGQAVEFRTLQGDITGDGVVNGADRTAIIAAWTGSGFTCQSDLNDDSVTNGSDRTIVISAWTSPSNTCPW
jgi:hypothetical protein